MKSNKNRALSIYLRYVFCLVVIATASLPAAAYTLVMRDGRHLSIPDDFIVSNLTLTYTAGERIQVTLQLATINIPATERANKEPPGSFLRRGQASAPISPPASSTSQREVTNRHLEKFREARLKSEAEYEERRKELGLPTLEEFRQQSVAQAEQTAETVREIRSQEQEEESYWRARASELRAELAATNARIDFIRARLNEIPANAPFGILATDLPFVTLSGAGFGPVVSTAVIQRSPFGGSFGRLSPRPGTRFGGGVHFGGRGTRGHINFGRGQFRGFRRSSGFFKFGSNNLLAIPFQDHSYERSELIVQLDELLGHRAGLQARWRDLEEEARRAGAYPGWLRP